MLTLGEQQLAVRLKIYFVDVTVLTQYLLQDIDEVIANMCTLILHHCIVQLAKVDAENSFIVSVLIFNKC